jgi:trans-aconitate methyltransferase
LAPERSVTGLDIDLDRLDVARTTAPGSSLVLGDMGSFSIPERFERILIPYNGLFALGSEGHILACLERVRAHLVPGGELCLDVYVVDDETERRLRSATSFEPLPTVVLAGRSIEVWERMVAGAEPETIEATYRFLGEGEEAVDVIRHKYLRPDRLIDLVEETGLRVVGCWSDFQGTPFDETGDLMVLRAVAPREEEP